MKILDTPISPLFGRTARELLLLAGFSAICVFELLRPQTNPWHLGVYVTFTGLFAARFFAARVVAIGVLLSAIAAHLANARYGAGWNAPDLHYITYILMGGVLLLMSRDLAMRFDHAESGPGWRLNRWRDLPRSHWRAATLLGWSLGVLGHFLLRAWQPLGDAAPLWPLVAIIGCVVCVFVLFTGRSIVFVMAAIIGIAVAIAVLPHVSAAEAFASNAFVSSRPADPLWVAAPSSALPTAIAALVTAAVALPYALRHLYRSLIQ